MNLYEIQVKHIAQKDSHESIEGYLIAENDEQVFTWVSKEKTYGTWEDRNNEDGLFDLYEGDDYIGEVTYKEVIIRTKGEINSEHADLSDLYYSKTHYGWSLVSTSITNNIYSNLKNLGVKVFTV